MVLKQRGFTLIEVMIVLVLVSLLAVAAVPFTSSWVASANVQQASGQVEQAIRMARALALRNPQGKGEDEDEGKAEVAALLDASEQDDDGRQLLQVCPNACPDDSPIDPTCCNDDDPTCCNDDDNPWRATLPVGVSLELDPDSALVRFNNRGVPINPHGNPVQVTYTLEKGDAKAIEGIVR